MKLKLYPFILLIAAGFAMTSCSERLESEFKNPEKHSPGPEEIIPGMFTQMLTNRFFVIDYGEWYWNFNGGFGIPAYAQISVRRPHPSENGYWEDWDILNGSANFYTDMEASKKFNNYYTGMKNWGLIRDELETLSGNELNDNEIFFLTASVLKDAIGLQIVDMFNKIPYSEAFQGSKGVFFPKYDDAKSVYVAILDDLKTLATTIPRSFEKLSQTAKETFIKQDVAFRGDPQKWVQYINSVRLRHAVRMSGIDPEYAKTHISDVLTALPTSDMIWPNTQKNENTIGSGAGGIYARAIYEQSYNTLIPNIIMQRMNYDGLEYVAGEDDPRLPVIANPTRYSSKNWQYTGCSMDYDAAYPYWPTFSNDDGSAVDAGPGLTARTFVNYPTNITEWLRSCYSQYNIATFTFGEIPSYMTSVAENDLFLAEVELKGLVSTGKSAAEHIRNAVIHSTGFWYDVNAYSNFWTEKLGSADSLKRIFAPDKPSDAIVGKFADKIKTEFENAAGIEDKMEIIMQQKYIHHNILNIYELWAELRRTRHPRLEKLQAKGDVFDPVPERIKYPSSEIQNNPDSYSQVVDESNFTSPVFWLPESKKSEKYYMDGYLPMKGFLPLPTPNPNRPAPTN